VGWGGGRAFIAAGRGGGARRALHDSAPTAASSRPSPSIHPPPPFFFLSSLTHHPLSPTPHTPDTLNNAFSRLWWGKVAYNDGSNPNVTQMWNLMFSNHTVSLTGAAYIADSSWLTQDGKPSVMLDYTDTNNIVFREMYDEMRYMANNVWLGE